MLIRRMHLRSAVAIAHNKRAATMHQAGAPRLRSNLICPAKPRTRQAENFGFISADQSFAGFPTISLKKQIFVLQMFGFNRLKEENLGNAQRKDRSR